jgi:hypothetical protein
MTETFMLQPQVSGQSFAVPALATRSNALNERFPWLTSPSPTASDQIQGAVRYLTQNDISLARAATSTVADREDFSAYLDPDD